MHYIQQKSDVVKSKKPGRQPTLRDDNLMTAVLPIITKFYEFRDLLKNNSLFQFKLLFKIIANYF